MENDERQIVDKQYRYVRYNKVKMKEIVKSIACIISINIFVFNMLLKVAF